MSITETTFGPKHYLTLKKSIAISEVTDKQMYDDAGKKLLEYVRENNLTITGPWSVLYFTWDQENQTTDLGIAFPIDGLETVTDPELSVVIIPETHASVDTLTGSYEGLGDMHSALMSYSAEHSYTRTGAVMALEEYIVDPMSESDPELWKTMVYHFHD